MSISQFKFDLGYMTMNVAFSCFVNKPTCHQSKSTTFIDLILGNQKNLFKLFKILKLVFLIIIQINHNKSGNFKEPPNKKMYRSYKNNDLDF